MDLVQVDHIGLQLLEAALGLADDVVVHAHALGAVTHRELRGDDHLVATAPQRVADEALTLALAVDEGRVDEVDAAIERVRDVDVRLLVIESRRAVDVPTESDDRNVQVGVAQATVFHDGLH